MKLVKTTIGISIIGLLILVTCRPLIDKTDAPELIIQPPSEANNIKVVQPVFGTIRNPGDTLNITWIAPTISKIDIQLFRKSEFKMTLAENLNNDGEFNWTIPMGFPSSNHYLIKIISNNSENIYNFSGQFGIQ
jgi:hypothetical protein